MCLFMGTKKGGVLHYINVRDEQDGPSTDPCGTPKVILLISEYLLSEPTHCCSFRRYEEENFTGIPLNP